MCVFLDLGYLYPNMNRVKLIVRGEDIDGERRIRNRNSTGSSDKKIRNRHGGEPNKPRRKITSQPKLKRGDLKQTHWRAEALGRKFPVGAGGEGEQL